MNSLDASSCFFYRQKVSRPVHFFTLFWKENAVIERAIPSERLHFIISSKLKQGLIKNVISTSTVLL